MREMFCYGNDKIGIFKRGRYFLSVVRTNSFSQVYNFNIILITFRCIVSNLETVYLWFMWFIGMLMLNVLKKACC